MWRRFMLTTIVGLANMVAFGYFTNWKAAVSLFIALWVLNAQNHIINDARYVRDKP